MLASGAKIRINEEGASLAIENLQAGEEVFNPITKKAMIISNIATRVVSMSEANRMRMLPITIKMGSITYSTSPNSDLVVSPKQRVFVPLDYRKLARKELEFVEADELSMFGFETEHLVAEKVIYYAIFCQSGVLIDANNLICETYLEGF